LKKLLDYSFIEILRTLDKRELKEFRKFAVSPYFNRSRKTVKLFDAIIKFHPHYESSKLTKEQLHKSINSGLPYNEITMRRLLFDLQKLSERYMKQINFEKKNIESRGFMTEEIGMRGAEKLFLKNTSLTEKMLEEKNFVNSDYFLSKYRLETDKFYFGMMNNTISKKSSAIKEVTKLVEGITYLIIYFMLEAIKHNDILLAYSNSYNLKQTGYFIEQFIKLFDFERLEIFMKKNSPKGSHIIEVYLNLLKSFLYFNDEVYYREFKKSLNRFSNELSPTDNHFLYGRLVSYCTLKDNSQSQENSYYQNELFNLYSVILENKYYLSETSTYIQLDDFRNILIIALRLNKIKWAENFIFDYGNQLNPKYKADVVNYSYGMLYFETGAYEDSLGYLAKINPDEFVFRLDYRVLMLKIYYEQKAYDSAFSMMRSYKKYVAENEMVNTNLRTVHNNFIKVVTKLLNYQRGTNKTDLITVMMHIEKSKLLLQKAWLTDKICELDNSISIAV